jgi:hypothetical protein
LIEDATARRTPPGLAAAVVTADGAVEFICASTHALDERSSCSETSPATASRI